MEFFKKYKKVILGFLFPILIFGGGFCCGGAFLLMDVGKGLIVAHMKKYEEKFQQGNKGVER